MLRGHLKTGRFEAVHEQASDVDSSELAGMVAGVGALRASVVRLGDTLEIGHMALTMHNIGIVVEDLGETIDFFRELGLELEGRAMIEGEWAGRVTGLG